MARIPLLYRIFFLYIDPIICLSGIYLFFFDHHTCDGEDQAKAQRYNKVY
jgi:hypothetical protein